VSELDVKGVVLCTFTGVNKPEYLSIDRKGHILVADRGSDRILLLNSQLRLESVLINTDSQVKLWKPSQLYFNELASELHVLHHSSSDVWSVTSVISQFMLR